MQKIVAEVARRTRTPMKATQIAMKAGKVVNKFKMAKHFELKIEEGSFAYARKTAAIEEEERLDGIYVVRTSEQGERWPAEEVVRGYKDLSHVERAFRCIKGVDLKVRPIWLRNPDHVKAHVFLCVLAYYVEWHLRRALAELLYTDEELEAKRSTRDPVLPTQPSESVLAKKATHLTGDGLRVQTFGALLANLATLVRNTCRIKSAPDGNTFILHTDPTSLQKRALELLGLYPVAGK